MISTSCHIVSRLAITGVLSVWFFNQTVVRPIRSGPRTGSTGRVVVSVCTTTVILVIAAHRTASKILSGEIGAPSTGENLTDTVPTARDGPACKPQQDFRPVANLASPLLAQTSPFPSSLSSSVLESSSSPVLKFLSSPVPESTPNITITLDLSNFTSNCNRLSITSDATLIAHDDDSKEVFTDETSDTKDAESSGDERTTHENNYAMPHTKDDHQVNILPPSATTRTIDNGLPRLPKLRPLFLVDKFRTTATNATNRSPAEPTHHSMDVFTKAANSLRGSLPGSAHPTDVLARKTKAAASWLRPLLLVTKHAAGRSIPLPPEKSRPHKLMQQKRKPRALRLNAACDSVARSRLRRHANRIVGRLTHVCEQIRVDQASLVDDWVAAMAEVGLTSMLAGNHPTSPRSPLPLTVDAVLVPEPGSRIKARIASLRHRTNVVAATIPATTATTTTCTPPLPWRRTSANTLRPPAAASSLTTAPRITD